LVTAAFIGPGTLLAASGAGAKFGFVLLWAVAFSVFATIVLQEMAARLGVVTGSGLSEALRGSISQPVLRIAMLGLVLLAIFIGNAAYQTGNILGAASGVLVLASQDAEDTTDTTVNSISENEVDWLPSQETCVFIIGAIALAVIWIGRFDLLQLILTLLVALMSLFFLFAAIRSNPDWSNVIQGFRPHIPKGGDWFVIGLVGTTVVPYNLFLHASAAAQRWEFEKSSSEQERRRAILHSRLDTILSVLVGGLVTSAILVTAGVAFHSADGSGNSLGNVKDIAIQLEPALGSWAKILFAMGLLAAGLTSAITAPIAAGYAAAGCFGWSGKLSDWKLKATASLVVVAGVVFAAWLGSSPKETIILAQVANGLLLPVIAIALLWMVNKSELMMGFKNRWLGNLLAIIVILIVSLIAVNQFRKVGDSLKKMMVKNENHVSETDHEFFE